MSEADCFTQPLVLVNGGTGQPPGLHIPGSATDRHYSRHLHNSKYWINHGQSGYYDLNVFSMVVLISSANFHEIALQEITRTVANQQTCVIIITSRRR